MYYMGLDIETDDPCLKDRGKQKAKGPSWIFGEGRVICTGLYNGKETKAFEGNGGDFVKKLLLRDDVTIVGANIQYDIGWLLSSFKMSVDEVKCHFLDISIVESLIDEYQDFSLDALAVKYLKEHKKKSELENIAMSLGLKGDFRQHLGKLWDEGYSREIMDYVASDADQPLRIWNLQKEIIERDNLWEGFHMNMDMIPVAISMQQKGVRIDVPKWEENCRKAQEAYEKLKGDFEAKYGKVNINSPKQLAELLDRFDVPYKKRITVKGYQPTDRKFTQADCFKGDELFEQKKKLKEIYSGITIEKGKLVLYLPKIYADRACAEILDRGYCAVCNPVVGKPMFAECTASYDIVRDLVQYKQVKNIVDKFLGPVFGRFLAPDGRLHGTFNVVGARHTGRISCRTPNLQQCLAEGSRVLTEKGYVPIEKIKVGDLIFNGNGDLTKVVNVWYKGIKNCTWTVCANNQFKIATTPDHKVWNGTCWQKAEELKHADIIQSRTGSVPLQTFIDTETDKRSIRNKQSYCRNLCEEVYARRRKGTDSFHESQENCYGLHTRGNRKRLYNRIFVPGKTFTKRFMSEIQNISKNRFELPENLSNERAESGTTCFEGGTGKIFEERSEREKASCIQRRMYEWPRIYNIGSKRSRRIQKGSDTSCCICSSVRYRGLGFAKVSTCASCRQKPLKQQLGQLGALFTKSTRNVTQTACGLRKVYDLEVASPDHSFIAEGFRVHNCPSKCRLFEKTDHEVDLAHMCRECFIPDEGQAFVKLDYCLSMDSMFLTDKGYVRGDEMYKGAGLLDLDGKLQDYECYVQERDMISFELDNGVVLKQIPEHRHFGTDKASKYVKLAKDFKVGDQLAFEGRDFPQSGVCDVRSILHTDYTDNTLGYVCGLYLGDGYVKDTGEGEIVLHAGNQFLMSMLDRVFTGGEHAAGQIHHAYLRTLFGKTLLKEFGRKEHKTVPDWVFTASASFRAGLIAGLLDTDAYITGKKCTIVMCREHLMRKIAELLACCGIYAKWGEQYVSADKNNFGKEHTNYSLYIRTIPSDLRALIEGNMLHRDLSIWKGSNIKLSWNFDWSELPEKMFRQHDGALQKSLYNARHFGRGIPLETMNRLGLWQSDKIPVTIKKIVGGFREKALIMQCDTHMFRTYNMSTMNCGQENRVVAHFAFGKNGEFVQNEYIKNPYFDEHDYVAKVSGLEEAHGKKVGRKFAKNLRFGVSYGMQKPGMMKNFGWTKEFCDNLYEKVAGAAPWLFEVMEKVQEVVLHRRYIRTLAGRHIHLRKGRDKDAYKYMNYLIQGSAADMTKKATVAISRSRKGETMILTVHDEDCFSVPMTEEGIDRIVELQHYMEHSSDLRVPAVCNPEIGPNWADGIEWSPEYGDVRTFIREVFKALKNGTFYKLKEKLGSYNGDESFAEFCESLEEEEEDDESAY